MKPLVSILIPTRKRAQGLCATITNLHLTASKPSYEILVMHDNDDSETIAALPALKSMPFIRIFATDRLGYEALDSGYYAALECEAMGHYVWIAGDDMLVYGDWMRGLEKSPRDMHIIQPHVSRLGWSAYPFAEGQAFPIFPRFCWKPYCDSFPKPFDTCGDALLRQNGWQTHFLENVQFHHNEAAPKEIEEHRK